MEPFTDEPFTDEPPADSSLAMPSADAVVEILDGSAAKPALAVNTCRDADFAAGVDKCGVKAQ